MKYKDNLISSFYSIHYHPDVAAAYAFFLGAYLVISIGIVFWSRYASSLFYLLSNLKTFASWFVHHLPFSRLTTSVIDQDRFPYEPPSSRDINPSNKDPKNQGMDSTNMGPHRTFVDDTIMAEVIYIFRRASDNSILTAYVFIRNICPVKEPISSDNFECFFTEQ